MSDPKHDSSGLTKEFIKEEFLKCADSCEHFLEQYGYIRTEEQGIQRFKLFDYQREIIQELQENRYLAILKSRQLGVSTIIAGFIAWYILFRKARHVFIMATKREKAGISFEMVKTFVLECPQWLRLYSVTKNNSMRFELSNGSWVKCQATSMDAGVGEAASLFFIDEAALIEKLREHWVGLFPTISTGGRCVMASTPRGVGNKFWEIVVGAQNGENEFKVKEYPWSRRFSKEWFEKERIGKTAREIAQEYECKFLESGDTFLDINVFEKMKQTVSEPIQKNGDLWIWKNAEFGHKYLIGADVARGDGKDFSAASVLDINTGEVVAEYRGKIKTNDFSEFLVNTGQNYNNALIIPESNSFGDAVIQRILELEYEDLYFSTKAAGGHSFGVLTHWESIGNRSARAGLHTTSVSRPAMLQKLEELIRLGIITIYSKRCYDEFTTFIWKGQRPEATRGSTDDIIMSLAICAVIKDRHFKDNTKISQKVDTLTSGFLSSRESFDIGKKQNNEMEQLALLIAKL